MTDLAHHLAAHAANFPADRVDERVRDHLALDLVDGLAAIVGGTRAPGVAELAQVLSAQARPGQAQRFASSERYPAVVAAQLNATRGTRSTTMTHSTKGAACMPGRSCTAQGSPLQTSWAA